MQTIQSCIFAAFTVNLIKENPIEKDNEEEQKRNKIQETYL